jgi:hypothetical protein
MLYIQVRQTLDWGDSAAVEAGLIARFRPQFEIWNATFDMPYGEFRRRLKIIAEDNWSRVRNARVVGPDAVPLGELFVPVDDDDWFAPELGERLGEDRAPAVFGYHWIRHILEPERRLRGLKGLLKEALTRKVIFATNNYALRKRDGLDDLGVDHLAATRHFHEHPRQWKYLHAALSMQNRSLASQTVLGLGLGRWVITREELIERFETYRTLYARTRLSRSLRWAEPYVLSMGDLMRELTVK